MRIYITILVAITFFACKTKETKSESVKSEQIAKKSFTWEGANLYFLLTDRFNNGDISNDVNFDRTANTAKLRGFEGGDLKGITAKINDGYFSKLGINAIWLTPIVEQVHGKVDEGTGNTYGFHGYWTKDWTKIDPNFGTKEDLQELVKTAHEKGIRILLDAVINHTGPVTDKDPVWPETWVRTSPQCTYDTYKNTVSCTLVKNLPDIKTESNEEVALPPQLVSKWKEEGRYEAEVKELNEFFEKTGFPKAPRFYIMKWLTDYIREYGIDGYRVDTVKHVEENVWQEFRKACDIAFKEYKTNHPKNQLEDEFYLVGEVYNYNFSSGKDFSFGDKTVNYFDEAFNSLINFEFKWNAKQLPNYEALFSRYDSILETKLKGYGTLNYISSHDDGAPFDVDRKVPFNAITKLLLTPGASQMYYGDESARVLKVEGAIGDANLRSLMNWDDIGAKPATKELLLHTQKLGQFRNNHPSIGAGKHCMITHAPYVFQRTLNKEGIKDEVIVGLDLSKGVKTLKVRKVFENGAKVRDHYSNQTAEVKNGELMIDSPFSMVLLERGN
ncbi:alpha-amylase [Tenacibaculum sp. MAR_2009_124]|uniref:alpha-amylase family glycosyl hydrolase n=1 Tax=Tenacibaculum sp. MAR_2009_124 TaxID=1250059 RepID=UPI0008948ED1|nr:alpha-amylase family glycosyl hydrolase [Tenacibaculum sp. MAR_2009_124]SEB48830.1 alpha-amylase [Tenacibaculum sp. MAR_2009_124]